MPSVKETIENKLRASFEPQRLEVVDESAKHHGHAGSRPEGETHFRVLITADPFRGVSAVERHRMIHQVLGDELAGPVHALALTTLAPEEDAG